MAWDLLLKDSRRCLREVCPAFLDRVYQKVRRLRHNGGQRGCDIGQFVFWGFLP